MFEVISEIEVRGRDGKLVILEGFEGNKLYYLIRVYGEPKLTYDDLKKLRDRIDFTLEVARKSGIRKGRRKGMQGMPLSSWDRWGAYLERKGL